MSTPGQPAAGDEERRRQRAVEGRVLDDLTAVAVLRAEHPA